MNVLVGRYNANSLHVCRLVETLLRSDSSLLAYTPIMME